MDFSLTAEQQMLADTAERLTSTAVTPRAAAWERDGRLPPEPIAELAGLGLLGVLVPAELDGAGLGPVELVLATAALARGSAALALVALGHNLVAAAIARAGSARARADHLGPLARGELLATSSLPFRGLETTRIDAGILTGDTAPLPAASQADLVLVVPHDCREAGLVERRALEIGETLPALAVTAAGLARARCRVPLDPATRLELPAEIVVLGRIGAAAIAVGIAAASIAEARAYAVSRRQFDRPLADYQETQWKLANAAAEHDAARALTLAAAIRAAVGEDAGRLALEAQTLAAGAAQRAADDALQLHGGYGYTREYAVERLYRDAELCGVVYGTLAEQRLALARSILEVA